MLAEFPGVADSLSCALAIQKAIAKHNQPRPLDRRLRFRIGLHLGDVLVRDSNLFGDAVNIAARLQALAEPGGICVSAAVREHGGTRLAAAFSDAGSQSVKNIAEPVHIFRVAAPAGSAMQIAGPRVVSFEGYTLDLTRGSLSGANGEIELRPKSLELLRYLAENPGCLIPKDELVNAV